MNASQHRNTRFEFALLQQGPNAFGVVVIERGTLGQPVPIELHESRFTASEMKQVQAVLELLETKAAEVYAEHEAKPEDLKAIINEAAEAKKALEVARLAAEQLELQAAAKRAEAEQLDADMARLRAEAGIVP